MLYCDWNRLTSVMDEEVFINGTQVVLLLNLSGVNSNSGIKSHKSSYKFDAIAIHLSSPPINQIRITPSSTIILFSNLNLF